MPINCRVTILLQLFKFLMELFIVFVLAGNNNLIIIGSPEENSLTQQFLDRIPLKYTNGMISYHHYSYHIIICQHEIKYYCMAF